MVSIGHLLVGGAAFAFAAVLIAASRAPSAELDGVLVVPGLVLAVTAVAFTFVAMFVLRSARHDRGGSLSLILSVVELAAGGVLAWGLGVAVQGYGAFEPWRSPLLLPTAALMGLGLWGIGLEVGRRARRWSSTAGPAASRGGRYMPNRPR